VYLEKARESLESAQAELINRRFNSSANRSYYACFQAAVYALARARIGSPRGDGQWSHEFVHGRFNGELINRRHAYPSNLRATLAQNFRLRLAADYGMDRVTEVRAGRAVSRAQEFLEAVEGGGV
jgi:uncharacterized protein (UPF0332 family)